MRVLLSVIGWSFKLLLGFMFAVQAPAQIVGSSVFVLAAFTVINAIGLHVLMNVASDELNIKPPKAVLIGLGVSLCLALGASTAYALPSPGCETCLQSNGWWWCFAIYGYYCL